MKKPFVFASFALAAAAVASTGDSHIVDDFVRDARTVYAADPDCRKSIVLDYVQKAQDGRCELSGIVCAGELNVRDFGAKGDGIADDTAAIAAAVKACDAHDAALKTSFEGDGAHASIVFPAGTYRVTDTVFMGHSAHLRAAGAVTIEMTDAGKDVFYFHYGSRIRVEGLRFVGGRNQLNLATLNHENANLVVRGCTFEQASSNAVKSISRRVDMGQDRFTVQGAVGEFMPDDKGVFRFEPAYLTAKPYNNSTFILVEDCDFVNCAHAMEFHSDGTVVRNCRVRQPAVAGASFVFTTVAHFYGLDVTVERRPGVSQSVFAPYGSAHVAIEDSTFRTTDGSGVLLVDSRICATFFIPGSLFVRDCSVACGGNPDGAVVRCRENTCPGILVMDGVRDTTGRPVRAVAFAGTLTEDWLRSASKRCSDYIPIEKIYNFSFGELSPNVATDGGAIFGRFVRPYPKDLPPPPVTRKPIRVYAGKVLQAVDFGVDADRRTDDTAAMEKFVAALAREPGSVGVLPGEQITVSRPIELKGDFALIGLGTARLVQKDGKSALFKVANGVRVKLENLLFMDGRHFVEFREKEARTTEIVVENCFGFNTSRWDAYDGACFHVEAASHPENVALTVTGGSYYQSVLYRGNAQALLDGFWFRSWQIPPEEKPLESSVAIVNLPGGALRAADILGVPCTLKRFGWSASNNPKMKKGDFRWTDNYGVFHSEFVRYGGEYGGITPVYAYGRAQTVITGSFGEYKAFSCRQSLVYSDGDDCDSRVLGMFYLSRPPIPEQDRRIKYCASTWLRQ